MSKTAFAAALLGVAVAGSAAVAQTAAPTPAPAPRMLPGDADGDGRVSRAEFLAQATARFDRLDGNGDGVLDATELRAGPRRGTRRGGATAPASPAPPPGA